MRLFNGLQAKDVYGKISIKFFFVPHLKFSHFNLNMPIPADHSNRKKSENENQQYKQYKDNQVKSNLDGFIFLKYR